MYGNIAVRSKQRMGDSKWYNDRQREIKKRERKNEEKKEGERLKERGLERARERERKRERDSSAVMCCHCQSCLCNLEPTQSMRKLVNVSGSIIGLSPVEREVFVTLSRVYSVFVC